MESPEERADMHGAHAKNQCRNKLGRFCRDSDSDGEGSDTAVGSKRVKVAADVGVGSACRCRGKAGSVARSDGKGLSSVGRSKHGKVAASVADGWATGFRAKGGRVVPSDSGGSYFDDKGRVRPVANKPSSSRLPLKRAFVIYVGSSSSEDVETNGQKYEPFMDEMYEYICPQISSQGYKNSTASSSKKAKETSEEKDSTVLSMQAKKETSTNKKMKQVMEECENSRFPQATIGERVANRKGKLVELKKTTTIPKKKCIKQKKKVNNTSEHVVHRKGKLQPKKKVNTTSDLWILETRVDVHGEEIEDILSCS